MWIVSGYIEQNVSNSLKRIAYSGTTNLLEDFKPDVFGPVRSNWGKQKSLELDISQDKIPVHAHSSRCGCFTVRVTGTDEIVQTGLESQFEVGTGRC